MRSQRGFTLVEVTVALGLTCAVLLVVLRYGPWRTPPVHVTALGLQGAIAEARTLAMSNAGLANAGATVSIEPEGTGSLVTVYASRPIAGRPAPEPDPGFPPQRFGAPIGLDGAFGRPFTILISSAGYASVAADYGYDPRHPQGLTSDPGCNEPVGHTISVGGAAALETHPLDCRETQYEAGTAATPAAS